MPEDRSYRCVERDSSSYATRTRPAEWGRKFPRRRYNRPVVTTVKRTLVGCLVALAVCAATASAAQPVSLKAKSPQAQGKKVFVHAKASTAERLEFLRLTGRIRVSGVTTYFAPHRTGTVTAGTSHTFTMRQDDPDQRRIVRNAMKRGKELTARIRCDFHPEGGDVIVRKVKVDLFYRDPDS